MIYVALNICHECNQDILTWSLRLQNENMYKVILQKCDVNLLGSV